MKLQNILVAGSKEFFRIEFVRGHNVHNEEHDVHNAFNRTEFVNFVHALWVL